MSNATYSYFHLSHAQNRIWFIQQLDNVQEKVGSKIFHVVSSFCIKGSISIERLNNAFNCVVERQSSLRTSFELHENEVRQKIVDKILFKVNIIDLKNITEEVEKENKVKENLLSAYKEPFNLQFLPLIRLHLIQKNANESILTVVMHHAISDGWSMDIFIKELIHYYQYANLNTLSQLPDLKIQYKDYTHWQNSRILNGKLHEQKAFWQKELEGELPTLDLPYDFPRPLPQDMKGSTVVFEISEHLYDKIIEKCRKLEVTPYVFFMATYALLLSKCGMLDEVIIGSSTSGRVHPHVMGLIGCFVNTLPVRLKVNQNITFADFLTVLQNKVAEIAKNQEYPFNEIIKDINVPRQLDRSPIFDTVFEFHQWSSDNKNSFLLDNNTEMLPLQKIDYLDFTQYDLMLECYQVKNKVYGYFQYCSALFKHSTIEKISSYFKNLLESSIDNVTKKMKDINFISYDEQQNQIINFSGKKEKTNIDEPAINLFEKNVLLNPKEIAVRYNKNNFTFSQINELSNKRAHFLKSKNIGQGNFVALYGHQSLDYLLAILSVFKVGAAYVPIDPKWPIERVTYILNDCDTKILFIDINLFESIENKIPKIIESVILMETNHFSLNEKQKVLQYLYDSNRIFDSTHLSDLPNENMIINRNPHDLAYMMYTSGSTGNPKGAMIRQDGMLHHIWVKVHDLGITNKDIIAETSSPSFDISVWQFLTGLIIGAKTVIIPYEITIEGERLIEEIKQENVSVFETVPTLMFSLLEYVKELSEDERHISNLKTIVVTGEEFPERLAREWWNIYPNHCLVNAYGATEVSDDVMHASLRSGEIEKRNRLPLGKVVANTNLYIVDRYKNLVPVGIKGEICFSGIQVGAGYWKNLEKTKEKFYQDLYCPQSEFRMLYATGDIGRCLENGEVEFLGRIDHQIKIRGLRVELGEIEAALSKIENIREAVLLVKKNSNNEPILVAYYVSFMGELPREQLRKDLLLKLPPHMVPEFFVSLSEMPTLSSGKADRKKLESLPLPSYIGEEVERSLTKIETIVKEIFSEVIQMENVPINASFFQLGGHSVSAVKVINRIRHHFNIEFQLQNIFIAQSIVELASLIEKTLESKKFDNYSYLSMVKSDKKEFYKLAPVQLPEWYMHELSPESSFYNISFDFLFEGEFNLEAFRRAFEFLIDRHQALRITFDTKDGLPVQKLNPSYTLKIEDFYVDKRHVPESEMLDDIHSFALNFTNYNFDFTKGPIFKVQVRHYPNNKFFFAFVSHHIVWDENSSIVFLNELRQVYTEFVLENKISLPPIKLDYIDYAEWMNQNIQQGNFDKQKEFWLETLMDLPPPLQLPIDFPRPAQPGFKGRTILNTLDSELSQRIHQFCQKNDVTLFMFFLSLFYLQLSLFSGQRRFVVGSPLLNRHTLDLEQMVGLFATAAPFVCNINSNNSFLSLLNDTKKSSIEVYSNHLYPLNLALEELVHSGKGTRQAPFNVFYGVLNDKRDFLEKFQFPGLKLTKEVYEYEEVTSRFDLTLAIDNIDDRIKISFNYDSELFKHATIEKMFIQFVEVIKQTLDDPQKNISEFSLINKEERDFLLRENLFTHGQIKNNKAIQNKFEEEAYLRPNAPAIISRDEIISYGELNEKANRIAHFLLAKNLLKEEKIVVSLQQGSLLIATLLAVLKSGSAYVPLPPDYPTERKKEILQAVQARFLLTEIYDNEASFNISKFNINSDCEVIYLDQIVWNNFSTVNPNETCNPQSLAYVLFTSGSTGKPKGIEIEHKGVVNLLNWAQSEYLLNYQDTVYFHTSYSFDASVLDIFWPLHAGARIAIPSQESLKNPAAIGKEIAQYKATVVQFVPAMLEAFVDSRTRNQFPELLSLRLVICGGEYLTRNLRDKFFQNFNCSLKNHYGPSEITVDATSFDSKLDFEGETVPIGKAIKNTRAFVLDTNLNLLPRQTVGEIFIESQGVARGYLNDPESTNKVFIPNPFREGENEKLYRTGDLGKVLDDGNIVFLGRADHQVKIRGNRVELEEIESRLTKIPEVLNASVVTRTGSDGEQELGALCVPNFMKLNIEGKEEDLKIVLVSQIPDLALEIEKLHLGSWPQFFDGDAILQKYWPDIYLEFPEYQFAIVNSNNEILGAGNMLPISWDGSKQDLPEGWSEGVQKAFLAKERKQKGNCLMVLAGVVSSSARGEGLSKKIIYAFKQLTAKLGYEKLIIPVRPTDKPYDSDISFASWCEKKNEKGMPVDKWLRVHVQTGGKLLKIAENSQVVVGSLQQWEDWTQFKAKESGQVSLPGTLSPVYFDLEKNVGHYVEPCVWFEHKVDSFTSSQKVILKSSQVIENLSQVLPSYMIPNSLHFCLDLPKLHNGKIDKSVVKTLAFQNIKELKQSESMGELEKKVLDIWKDVLKIEKIGLDDSFFEVGGHSLRAAQTIIRINEAFSVSLSLRDFFINPTIRGLSELVSKRL